LVAFKNIKKEHTDRNMESQKIFYTYLLIDPRNNKPFYVGKGKGRRWKVSVNSVKNNKVPHGNTYLFNKIKKILDSNLEIIFSKILENVTEDEAFICEQKYIEEHDGLCNLTTGGEGPVCSDATKDKIANTLKEKRKDPKYKETILAVLRHGREKMTSDQVQEWKDNLKKAQARNYGDWVDVVVKCAVCEEQITFSIRSTKLEDFNRKNHYCGYSCSNSTRGHTFQRTDEYKRKVSSSLKKNLPPKQNKTSKFRGVSFKPLRKMWDVTFILHKKRTYIGAFDNEETAAKAYDAVSRFFCGAEAVTNFEGTEVSSPEEIKKTLPHRPSGPKPKNKTNKTKMTNKTDKKAKN